MKWQKKPYSRSFLSPYKFSCGCLMHNKPQKREREKKSSLIVKAFVVVVNMSFYTSKKEKNSSMSAWSKKKKKSRRRKTTNVTCMQIVLRQTSIHLIYVKNYFYKKIMTSRSDIMKEIVRKLISRKLLWAFIDYYHRHWSN